MAQTPEELASCQRSSLKMMLWVVFFAMIFHLIGKISVVFHLPSLNSDIAHFSNNGSMHLMESWIIVILRFFERMSCLTITGNLPVALAHFVGFRIPKNTMAPLFSKSLADFWNRYSFYFKELLVDFFFIPAFQRLMFIEEKWRIFIATLFAAGVGNYLYHLIKGVYYLPQVGLLGLLKASVTYALYCAILAVGIGLSQLLSPLTDKNKTTVKPHVCLMVLLFYAVTEILDYAPASAIAAGASAISAETHLKYLFYLFGGKYFYA